jgi:acetyl esterase/lipase
MNLPTLMTKLAALRGHPLPISSHPAPPHAEDSELIRGSAEQQVKNANTVRIVRNVEFARYPNGRPGGSDVVLRMDLVQPKAPGRHPLVVYVPGGGFVVAPKVGGARLRRYVAAAGYVVASVEYRTTRQDATYLDGIADVRAAIRHLIDHADEYSIDPTRVAVWGESAGGYLAAMVGLTQRSTRGVESIRAVIDKFGGSSLERLAEGFDDATIAATYAPGNAPARYVHGPAASAIDQDLDALRAADPVSHVSADAPAFLLFHGDDDRLISPIQTAVLHQALRSTGADSTRYLVTAAGHGDIAVKGGEEKLWTTVPMMQLLVEFLNRTLKSGA